MRNTPSRRSVVATAVLVFLFITTGFAIPTFTETILPFLHGDLNANAAWLGGVSAPALEATINTNKDDYSPGQIVQITGSGWQPNETVRLEVDYVSTDLALRSVEGEIPHGHDPWFVQADSAGNVSSQWLVEEDSRGRTLLLKADGLSSGFHAEKIFYDAASITIEQCHNFDGAIVDCVKISSNTNYWGSGNAQQGNALLSEGDNQNFRAIMEQVPPGTYTLDIELDLTKGGKVAYDRYSSPGRIRTATAPTGIIKASTTAGPLSPEGRGVFPCSDSNNDPAKWCTPQTGVPYLIPAYGATLIPTPVADPLFRADVLASQSADAPEHMFLYGGGPASVLTMNTAGYSFSGDTTGDSSIRFSMMITKTSNVDTPMVLAWGGHISKTQDYVTSGHTTATSITGSPYHMRLKAFSALQGSPGNQDMQMAASAIVAPTGTITITKQTVGGVGTFGFTAAPTPSPIPANFNIDTSGANPNSVSFANVPNGSYTFTESSLPPGWSLGQINCTISQGGTSTATPNVPGASVMINLQGTDTVNCTFINNGNATLTLVKNVVNNNGGTRTVSDFPLSAAGPTAITNVISGTPAATNVPVTPGSYTLSEQTQSDYTSSLYSCVKNGGGAVESNSISLAAGDSATCTITNNDIGPELHLRKIVVNDNGGTATVADFVLTANGTGANDISGTSPVDSGAGLLADTFALSETSPGGYTASAWVCVGGTQNGSNITVGLNQSATCTITNNDIPPQLHLRKVVVNDNGGTATVADFVLTGNGTGANDISGTSPVDSGAGLLADTFALSETSPGGYTASAWVCVGGTQNGSNITVGIGQSATCTITNNDIPPQLHLRKVVVNDNGGTATVADFVLTGNGTGANDISGTSPVDSGAGLLADTFALSETSPGGYTASAWVCVGGTQNGSNITVGVGQSATCTITNNDIPPQLHLRKVVVNDNGGTATVANFVLTGNGTGTNDISGTSPVDSGAGLLADTFALSETSPGGYTASAWVCVGGTQNGSNITVGIGQSATCTITNNDIPPQLHLRKVVVNDNGGTATVANFVLTGNGTGTNDISGTSPVDSGAGLLADTFALSETSPGGYTASAWVCVGGTQNGSNITVGIGQSATCTITNNDIPPELHLRKVVVNDNGGTATVANFTLTGNGTGTNDISGTSPVDSGAGLLADTFALSETSPGGYTASAWVCVGGTQNGSNITVGVGQSATCTITNNDIPPQLHLRKVVINDNGGTATVANFVLTGNGTGTNDISGTSPVDSGAGLLADTFALSETSPGGYTASAWVCVGGTQNGSNITVGIGQSATCTITNNDNAPELHLRKVVINDNGGTATVADFVLTGNGTGTNDISGTSPVDSGPGLLADTFALSETSPGGYTASAWVCVGGTQNGSNITVGVGQSATCTITNNDNAPELHLRKVVINDNGGTATVADFVLTGNGTGTNDISGTSPVDSGPGLLADTFALSETSPGGYTASAWVCVGGTQNGSNITVGVGQSATCTITNNDIAPTLRVIKLLVPTNDPGLFNLQIDGSTAGTGANVGHNGTTGFVPVTANVQHTVGETAGTATSLSDYGPPVFGGDCNASGQITLALAQNATCTITNRRLPTLKIRKVIDGTSHLFEFVVDGAADDPADATLTPPDNGEASTTAQNITVGDHNVQEVRVPDGWLLSDGSCESDQPDGFVTSNVGLPVLTFTARYGDDITCTFVNNEQGGATRTQGFWATHTVLTNTIWNGGTLPPGTTGQNTNWTPVIGSPDQYLCKPPTIDPPFEGVAITAIPQPGMNQVMGGFWSGIATTTTRQKRSALDKARMQFLQQYLAAVLNVHIFGTPIPGTTLANARATYCGTDSRAIITQAGLLGAYNESGDSGVFTPGANATAQLSKSQADLAFWDTTFR